MSKKSSYKENGGKVSAYHHISDGGLSISIGKSTFVHDGIVKNITPVFDLKINHYGVQTNHIKMNMSPRSLQKLGKWLLEEGQNAEKWTMGNSYISSELELSNEVRKRGSSSIHSDSSEEDSQSDVNVSEDI